jgi:hypothetical protein
MIICKRCGKCCHYLYHGKEYKCRFLVKLPDGTTVCRIYKNRIGTNIDGKARCGPREQSSFNYEGCDYNILSPNKPMFPQKIK